VLKKTKLLSMMIITVDRFQILETKIFSVKKSSLNRIIVSACFYVILELNIMKNSIHANYVCNKVPKPF